jgi:hypothetical protein
MKFEIAVPSYKRPERCRDATLAFLARCGSEAPVTVFVADEEQRAIYERALDPKTYTRLVVGVPGMGAIRNFIHDHYAPGTRILHVDDDIEGLFVRVDEKHLVEHLELDAFVETAFGFCEQSNARLWGIYPVNNPYFMKPRVTFDLRYVIGSFWGSVNKPGEVLMVSLDDKEDFERTMKCYAADGAVVRMEYATVKSRYYTEPGGMQETRTPERVRKSAEQLARRYPQFCSLNTSKKSGFVELRLRDKRVASTA